MHGRGSGEEDAFRYMPLGEGQEQTPHLYGAPPET